MKTTKAARPRAAKSAAEKRKPVKRARTLRGKFREAYAKYLNNWSMGYEADNCVNAAIKAAEAAAVAEERERCANVAHTLAKQSLYRAAKTELFLAAAKIRGGYR